MLNFRCSIEHSTLNIEHYGCLPPKAQTKKRRPEAHSAALDELPSQERCNSAALKKKLVRGMALPLLRYLASNNGRGMSSTMP
jgi:hypothetical protein